MANWRDVLLQIDSELKDEDLQSLKFLCLSSIKRKEACNVNTGHALFSILEVKEMITNKDFSFLYMMLQTIGRIDLCNLIIKSGVPHIQVDSELECNRWSKFHKMLFDISENMCPDEVSRLRFLNESIPKNKKIKIGLDLFSSLIDLDLLGPSNLDTLIKDLDLIGRKDLVRELMDFRDNFTAHDECIKQSSAQSSGDVQEVCPRKSPVIASASPNQTIPKAWPLFQDLSQNFESSLDLLDRDQVPVVASAVPGKGTEGKLVANPLERVQSKKSENFTIHTRPSGVQVPKTQDGNQLLDHYKMTAKPRGICLVIDNQEFTYNPRDRDAKHLKERKGSNKDRENIKKCFEALHFDVRIENNLTDTDMLKTFDKYAQDKKTNEQHDCFVTFVLSHGGADRASPFLYGSNGRKVFLEKILSLFRPDRCHSLWGKPKLFFLACCLGGSYSEAVPKPESQIETDSSINFDSGEGAKSFVSNDEDFLIGYSTITGNVSFRDTEQGTWYITALTQVFSEYHKSESIQHMLVEVNNRVARNRFERTNEHGDVCRYAQVPAPQHTLTKQLWF